MSIEALTSETERKRERERERERESENYEAVILVPKQKDRESIRGNIN